MKEELCDKIKHIANLPTLPQVASRLMRIVREPNTSAETVAALVAQDISLSAKILRLANSAFYGVPRSINNINNAVVILGFKIIQTMVLGLTVFDMFGDSEEESRLFDRKEFWMHSLKCGTAAKLLALRCRQTTRLDPEEAFCAGLLHDVGKIVMEQYLHQDFHKALRLATRKKISHFEAENEVLGYNHCDVAGWLTSTWSLPEEIELALEFHHTPDMAPGAKNAVTLCYFANYLSKTTSPYQNEELKPRLALLGLEMADLQEVAEAIPEELQKVDGMFGNALE